VRDLFEFLICLDCTPVVSSSPALLGVEPVGGRFHASPLFLKESRVSHFDVGRDAVVYGDRSF
jgi:hypothetical protein